MQCMNNEETDTETSNNQTEITLWSRVLTFNQSDEQHKPTIHTVSPIYKVNVAVGLPELFLIMVPKSLL